MKILIVEDEKLLCDSLQAVLTKKGFQVEVAYDGETGRDYALLGIYDLLILDVMMPFLNGYELARQVRAKRCFTPILMLSAKSSLEDRIEGLIYYQIQNRYHAHEHSHDDYQRGGMVHAHAVHKILLDNHGEVRENDNT